MILKPWREVVAPHRDVLEGTFQQSEFAADITAVRMGRATAEYQNAAAFYQRTYITEGMRLLLTQVAERLCGRGGEPVLQLQTAFGGGKTHTLLAVYHLATRPCPLAELPGVAELIDRAGLMDVPRAAVAVIDGSNLGPGTPTRRGSVTVHTLWGELAWQLGGEVAYARVREADETGTNPGKEVLRELLEAHAPCVVLIDELVSYMRQFTGTQKLSGGSYGSNLSFVQSLTEACKLVPNAILLASLPESEVEAGSQDGVQALRALEKTFGRVQALWRPVATEEAFEIVRRRLFEPVRDEAARDGVCRAYMELYLAEKERLPVETQESRYLQRLLRAYPVHPEVFDRLYEDWTPIEGFQRTRGVLKLMAKVIHRLWRDENRDTLILPGSLPLFDPSSRNELTYYLPTGWDPVIERDIDGERAETTSLESRETRFGPVNAARRVARTLFLATAPSSTAAKRQTRGIDRARVLLGCVQPGQTASLYIDALGRLADRLHFLNSSGDKTLENTRYWFDTRATLRREMEERKQRFAEGAEVRGRLAEVMRRVAGSGGVVDGVHCFTPHSDVPDDTALRLVILPPEAGYTREEPRMAVDPILDMLRNNGARPRQRVNRLLFLAADLAGANRAREAARTALAWASIVEDIRQDKLIVDQLQRRQAEKELQMADDVLTRSARDAYKWLLAPTQETPTSTKPTVEAYAVVTSTGSLSEELKRVCVENELVIETWSPIHLRNKLREFYWKSDRSAVTAMQFWEDTLRYLYLPRLRQRETLARAIEAGAVSRDFFGTAHGVTGDRFEGLQLGSGGAALNDTLLLVELEAAKRALETREAERAAEVAARAGMGAGGVGVPYPSGGGAGSGGAVMGEMTTSPGPGGGAGALGVAGVAGGQGSGRLVLKREYHGTMVVNPAGAKMRLVQAAEEVITMLAADPRAEVSVTLEIHAVVPHGASPELERSVRENANALKFRNNEWT